LALAAEVVGAAGAAVIGIGGLTVLASALPAPLRGPLALVLALLHPFDPVDGTPPLSTAPEAADVAGMVAAAEEDEEDDDGLSAVFLLSDDCCDCG
jgi:hypothetical protein